MAIKLSQGLLSSLGAAGGTPQDARQPMGSGLLQPALSSNPLVNTLVRSIGQARGMDMRTGQEKLTQALAQVDPQDPNAESMQLAALIKFGEPAQQLQATQRLKQIESEKQEKLVKAAEKQQDLKI